MKKIFGALTAVCMFLSSSLAQTSSFQKLEQTSERRAPERVLIIERIPRIIVSPNREPIFLRDLKVNVEVTGNLALTTYDMTFFNPNSVVMEGEFIMPLAENQNVSAIALDINGRLRDGVVVEKQKARKTFEDIVRRGVDPGLVEKTAGNQFKTRIYPFNPSNTRRIKITIEEPLQTKNNAYIYSLPLTFNQTINFSFNAQFPAISGTSVPLPKITGDLTLSSNNSVFSFSQNDFLLNNTVSFEIPKPAAGQIFTHREDKETFFYSDISVPAAAKDKVLPKKILILWDASLSGAKRDIQKELQLLDGYFKKISNAEADFAAFNLKTQNVKNFSVKNGDWSALKKEIEAVKYDGATALNGFNKTNADEILLFSDGINTFSNSFFQVPGKPVYAINSSAEFNRANLLNISRQSGGRFINLNSLTPRDALNKLLKQTLKLISYSYIKGSVKEIFPPQGTEIGENLTLSGILTAPAADITVSFGYDKNDITATKKISISAEGNNPAVARLWAQAKIMELELDAEKNEEEITKLAKDYALVTDFTSLLVLENVSDYVNYKITPPQELLAEYNRLLSYQKKEEENSEKNNIADAIMQAREIKDWWKKDFEQTKPQKQFKPLQPADAAFNSLEDFKDARRVSAENRSNLPVRQKGETRAKRRVLAENQLNLAVRPEEEAPAMPDNNMSEQKMRSAAKTHAPNGNTADKSAVTVQIKAWDPQTPYMKILKASADNELYADYLKLKTGFDDQPSFYFDAADEFIRRKLNDKAILVLSNIAEMRLDNPELLRTTANKLMEIEQYKYAIELFTKILKLRGEDPQSCRDLALAYQADGQYQKALEYFYKVLSGSWGRFNSIKQIVFVEMNNLVSLNPKLNLSKIDKELIFAMPVDLRIVLGWSTDSTDIDIHVKDPYLEEAYYMHRLTSTGGKVSTDFRQGFGPEEFMIKKALKGKYEVFTNNFADRRQSLSGPTVLYLDIFTNYGSKNQTVKRVLVRTENVKQNNIIGTVSF